MFSSSAFSAFKLAAWKLGRSWIDWPRNCLDFSRILPAKPLFITGAHRCGTTWVGAMMSDPGCWYLHEPFAPHTGIWPEEFSYCPVGGQCQEVDRLMDGMLAGRERRALKDKWSESRFAPVRLFPMPGQPRRLLIKDPLACLLAPYICNKYDLNTIIIWRHPLGFAESVVRLGWPVGKFIRYLLKHDSLQDAFTDQARKIMQDLSVEDSLPAAVVLHGALYRVMINELSDAMPLLQVDFEMLCNDPISEFKKLYEFAGWPYDDGVVQRHRKLTTDHESETAGYHPHRVSRDSKSQAWKWKKKVASEQASLASELWSYFDLARYGNHQQWETES